MMDTVQYIGRTGSTQHPYGYLDREDNRPRKARDRARSMSGKSKIERVKGRVAHTTCNACGTAYQDGNECPWCGKESG